MSDVGVALAGPPAGLGASRVRRRRRVLIAMLVVACALAGSAVAFAPRADAGIIAQDVLRNVKTGLCLDSNWDGHVYTLECHTPIGINQHQLWKVIDNPNYQLANVATGRCLNVGGHNHGANWIATDRCTYTANGGLSYFPGSVWTVFGSPWRYTKFWGRETCLDSNWAGHVYPLGCNNGDYQRWSLGY